MIIVFGSSSWCSHTGTIRECNVGLVWLSYQVPRCKEKSSSCNLLHFFSWSSGFFSLSRWAAASSCSEVGCRRLQILQIFLPLHSLDKGPHLRHPQQSALAWENFLLSERGIFGNLKHRSSSWFSLQKGQMTRYVLLELVFSTAFSFSSDEPVARVLASKFPFSRGLKLVLLGLLFVSFTCL